MTGHGAGARGTRAALAIAAMAAMAAPSARAGSFDLDNGIEGRWSLQGAIGAGWRLRAADPSLVAVGNGGLATDGNDDGDLNYAKNHVYTTTARAVGDLELQRDHLGVFVRAKGWVDQMAKDQGVPHGSVANAYVPGAKLDDTGFDDRLSRFSGVALMDAYAFGQFDAGEHPVAVRLGNQVVNWGESLFVPGVNQYGAFDVPAAHRPGAQVKEILLPVPQAWASVGLGGGASLEAFYQFQWKRTVLDGCGTYWSAADGLNCPGLVVNPLPIPDAMAYSGIPPLGGLNARMDRLPDRKPGDGGEWGLAGRWMVDAIGTEFGAYWVEYSQRFPTLGISKTPSNATSIWQAGVLTPAGSEYFWDYSGRNIKVAGLSASTAVAGWSFFGEASRTMHLPVGYNGADTVLGTLAGAGPLAAYGAVPAGETIEARAFLAKNQLQAGFLKVLPRVAGADQLTLLGEVAGQHWNGIGDPMTSVRYGRGFSYGQAETATIPCAMTGNADPAFCETKGFATKDAWGFRLFGELSYPDVVAGANLKPRLFWSQDVKGWSADGTFSERRRSLSLGLRMDYRESWYVDVSVNLMDKKATYDSQHDRDHADLVIGFNL